MADMDKAVDALIIAALASGVLAIITNSMPALLYAILFIAGAWVIDWVEIRRDE